MKNYCPLCEDGYPIITDGGGGQYHSALGFIWVHPLVGIAGKEIVFKFTGFDGIELQGPCDHGNANLEKIKS
jgi:hypothetical protein